MLRKEVDAARTRAAQASSALFTAENKLAQLTDRHQDLEDEHDTLQADFDMLQQQHDTLQAEHDTLQAEHHALQTAQTSLRAECDRLKTQRDPCTDCTDLRNALQNLQMLHARLKTDYDRLADAGKRECTDLRAEIDTQMQTAALAKRRLAELESKRDDRQEKTRQELIVAERGLVALFSKLRRYGIRVQAPPLRQHSGWRLPRLSEDAAARYTSCQRLFHRDHALLAKLNSQGDLMRTMRDRFPALFDPSTALNDHHTFDGYAGCSADEEEERTMVGPIDASRTRLPTSASPPSPGYSATTPAYSFVDSTESAVPSQSHHSGRTKITPARKRAMRLSSNSTTDAVTPSLADAVETSNRDLTPSLPSPNARQPHSQAARQNAGSKHKKRPQPMSETSTRRPSKQQKRSPPPAATSALTPASQNSTPTANTSAAAKNLSPFLTLFPAGSSADFATMRALVQKLGSIFEIKQASPGVRGRQIELDANSYEDFWTSSYVRSLSSRLPPTFVTFDIDRPPATAPTAFKALKTKLYRYLVQRPFFWSRFFSVKPDPVNNYFAHALRVAQQQGRPANVLRAANQQACTSAVLKRTKAREQAYAHALRRLLEELAAVIAHGYAPVSAWLDPVLVFFPHRPVEFVPEQRVDSRVPPDSFETQIKRADDWIKRTYWIGQPEKHFYHTYVRTAFPQSPAFLPAPWRDHLSVHGDADPDHVGCGSDNRDCDDEDDDGDARSDVNNAQSDDSNAQSDDSNAQSDDSNAQSDDSNANSRRPAESSLAVRPQVLL